MPNPLLLNTTSAPTAGVLRRQTSDSPWNSELTSKTAVFEEVLGPSLEDLGKSIQRLDRSSSGLFEITASVEPPERRQAPPVFESDDMRQVSFPCHPKEPVKVDEAWRRPVHCLSCGRISDASP